MVEYIHTRTHTHRSGSVSGRHQGSTRAAAGQHRGGVGAVGEIEEKWEKYKKLRKFHQKI